MFFFFLSIWILSPAAKARARCAGWRHDTEGTAQVRRCLESRSEIQLEATLRSQFS
jgi:hypothetical protein